MSGPPPTCLIYGKVSSESAVLEFGGLLGQVLSESPCGRGWASASLIELRGNLEGLWPGCLGVSCDEVSSGSRCRRSWASKGPHFCSSQRSSGSLVFRDNVAGVEARARGTVTGY
eukprot:6341691-Pyramimonas_sp.AAC.1